MPCRFIAVLALLPALAGCAAPNSEGWQLILHEARSLQAVQLHFKEGLASPGEIKDAEAQLAESLAVPVIPSEEDAGDKKVLKILVDSSEKSYFDGKGLARAWSTGVLLHTLVWGLGDLICIPLTGGAPVCAAFGFLWGAIGSPIIYNQHNDFKKKYGYLPNRFSAFATFGGAIAFGEGMRKAYTAVPLGRYGYPFSKYSSMKMPKAMQQLPQGGAVAADCFAVSLNAWLQALSKDLSDHGAGGGAAPPKAIGGD